MAKDTTDDFLEEDEQEQEEETTTEQPEETKQNDEVLEDEVKANDDEPSENDTEENSNDEAGDGGEEDNNENGELNAIEIALAGKSKLLSNLAGVLLDYNTTMNSNTLTPQHVSKHYSLYNTIKSVLSREDDKDRTDMLTLICAAFSIFSKEGFNNVKLFRFDTTWKWSKNSLEAANMLLTVFVTLSNPETRKAELKTINFENIHELVDLTPEQATAVELYFNP